MHGQTEVPGDDTLRAFFILDIDVLLLQGPPPLPLQFRCGSIRADESAVTLTPLEIAEKRSSEFADAVLCCRLWGRCLDGSSACVVIYNAWSTRWLLLDNTLSQREAEQLTGDFEQSLRRRQADLGELAARVTLQTAVRSSGWSDTPLLWLEVATASPFLTKLGCSHHFQRSLGRRPRFSGAQAFTRLSVETELFARTGVRPCSWCSVSAPFVMNPPTWKVDSVAHASLTSLKALDGRQMPPLPRLRLLSFDLECVSQSRGFPDPKQEQDTICTVGVVLRDLAGELPQQAVALVCSATDMSGTQALAGATVLEYESEAKMLLGFADFVRKSDADVIVGYNTDRFDWNYVLERVELLKRRGQISPVEAERCLSFSRAGLGLVTPPKLQRLQSAAYGDNPLVTPRIPGRLGLDLWLDRKRENSSNLPNLKLNTLAAHYLKDQKHDMEPQELFRCVLEGSDQDRGRVAAYCLQDCVLVLDLLKHVDAITATLEMARITGVAPQDLLHRGQGAKVYSLLALACWMRRQPLEDDRGIWDSNDTADDHATEYEGAKVLDPKIAFYTRPTIVLDYQSLYPSLMRTLNMSFDTYVSAESPLAMKQTGLVADLMRYNAEKKHQFVPASVKQGIVPHVLEGLLDARKEAKKQMVAAPPGSPLHLVLNARQLGLKVVANSVYGFLGSKWCPLPMGFGAAPNAVAEAITACARAILELTRDRVETCWPNVTVVYGDTDSVFVQAPECASVGAEPFELGRQMAMSITSWIAENLAPTHTSYLKLEFEKCLTPFCLLRKKRYFGLLFEEHTEPGRLYAKGIELVRRDSTPHLRQIQQDVIQQLMKMRLEKAAELAERALVEILEIPAGGPFDKIVQSKTLKGSYAAPDSLPHVQLTRWMEKREAGSAPRPGERVEFIVVASSKARVLDAIESPAYAVKHKLPPAWDHYMQQLQRALEGLLEVPFESQRPDLLQTFRKRCAELLLEAQRKVMAQGHARLPDGNWVSGCLTKGGGIQMSLTAFKKPRVS